MQFVGCTSVCVCVGVCASVCVLGRKREIWEGNMGVMCLDSGCTHRNAQQNMFVRNVQALCACLRVHVCVCVCACVCVCVAAAETVSKLIMLPGVNPLPGRTMGILMSEAVTVLSY